LSDKKYQLLKLENDIAHTQEFTSCYVGQ